MAVEASIEQEASNHWNSVYFPSFSPEWIPLSLLHANGQLVTDRNGSGCALSLCWFDSGRSLRLKIQFRTFPSSWVHTTTTTTTNLKRNINQTSGNVRKNLVVTSQRVTNLVICSAWYLFLYINILVLFVCLFFIWRVLLLSKCGKWSGTVGAGCHLRRAFQC